MAICKSKSFNLAINDLKSLNSFNELLLITPNNSKAYFTSLIENFYTDIIELSKDEFYWQIDTSHWYAPCQVDR